MGTDNIDTLRFKDVNGSNGSENEIGVCCYNSSQDQVVDFGPNVETSKAQSLTRNQKELVVIRYETPKGQHLRPALNETAVFSTGEQNEVLP